MVTDDEIPDTVGETRDKDDETVASSLSPGGPGGNHDGSASASDPDLDTIITGALTVLDHAEPQDLYLPELAPSDQERVDEFLRRGRAAATLQSYKSDWDLFLAWCLERGYRPLPATPATVAAFLSELATTGFTPAAERRTNR